MKHSDSSNTLNADPYNLKRFLDEQDSVYDQVLSELRQGIKRGHWMWFIFPQLAGLGNSPTAKWLAISSIEEAKAYSLHPTLGGRLIECAELVNQVTGRKINRIFGYPDDLKFISCMTLFAIATSGQVFTQALQKYSNGDYDSKTLELLRLLDGGHQKP